MLKPHGENREVTQTDMDTAGLVVAAILIPVILAMFHTDNKWIDLLFGDGRFLLVILVLLFGVQRLDAYLRRKRGDSS